MDLKLYAVDPENPLTFAAARGKGKLNRLIVNAVKV
jgi:hypothetical protein